MHTLTYRKTLIKSRGHPKKGEKVTNKLHEEKIFENTFNQYRSKFQTRRLLDEIDQVSDLWCQHPFCWVHYGRAANWSWDPNSRIWSLNTNPIRTQSAIHWHLRFQTVTASESSSLVVNLIILFNKAVWNSEYSSNWSILCQDILKVGAIYIHPVDCLVHEDHNNQNKLNLTSSSPSLFLYHEIAKHSYINSTRGRVTSSHWHCCCKWQGSL